MRNQIKFTLPEIFAKVAELKTRKEQAMFLNQHDSKELRWFLFHIFHEDAPKITGLKIPKYQPLKNISYGHGHVNLGVCLRRVEMLRDVSGIDLARREKILFALLTSVHPEEAQIIEMLVSSNFKMPKITRLLASAAFPELIPPKKKATISKTKPKT